MTKTQQPVYLLAGGRGRSILTTCSTARELIRNTGKTKPNIAYVGVTSLRDNWLIYALVATFIKSGCNCRINRVVIASRNADLDQARKMLQNADAVFFCGGDVEAGMQILEEKKMVGFFRELVKEDKLVFGISAGSILMSKEWVRWRDPEDDSSVELFPCLGLVPVICDTHAEKDDWVELQTALRLGKTGTPGYGIISGSCLKVFPDGSLEVESGMVVRYKLVNGQIERQADLVPIERKS